VKQLSELAIYILKQEFPQLSLTEDPDIERYFEFRSLNRQAEALQLYNTKLIQKYPDDKERVLLMTYYRKHDYRFHILLTDSLARLADKTVTQVKKVIIFFTTIIAPLKTAKVYTIIQVCEKVITAISPDRFAAIGFTEKYVRYAEKLNFYAGEMRLAADIIRMYITDTISSVREFREERERQSIRERNLLAAQKAQASVIDFSKIVFTEKQISAITVPPSITRIEDKVLAYTMKYWNRYDDGAFENMLLLYSRKYGTNHYAVFQAVKIGRSRRWKDEELLHSVLANVAQGYYYSITGDLYLQRAWKQIRLKLDVDSPQQQAFPPPAAKKVKRRTDNTEKQETVRHRIAPSGRSGRTLTAKAASVPSASIQPPAPKTETIPALSAAAPSPLGDPLSSQQVKLQHNTVEPAVSAQPVTSHPVRQTAAQSPSTRIPAEPPSFHIYPISPPKEQPLSIAETVKRVTGKNYGIYRDLFFKEIRPSIRAILQHSAVQKLSFFGTEQNNAENIIYRFLEMNYDNPYQQWQGSQQQSDVLAQGFRVDSLEPIIRHWAKGNR